MMKALKRVNSHRPVSQASDSSHAPQKGCRAVLNSGLTKTSPPISDAVRLMIVTQLSLQKYDFRKICTFASIMHKKY